MRFLVVPLLLATAMAANPQDEQTVRLAYAKFAYAVQTYTVHQAVAKTPTITSVELAKQLQDNELRFEITDMRSGPLSDIATKPYSNFVPTPPEIQQRLEVVDTTQTARDSDIGIDTTSYFASAHWETQEWLGSSEQLEFWSTPLQKVLRMGGDADKFSRYVTATITVRFQGKSLTYRTLWLFGSETQSFDPVSGNVGTYTTRSVFPSVFTDIPHFRSHPAVSEWLSANQRFESSCKLGKQDVCCDSATMHCGVAADDLRSAKPAATTKTFNPKGGL